MSQKKIANQWIKSTKCQYLAIVKNENEKYVIVMGNAQVSPKEFESIESAEDYIAIAPLELICEIVITTIYLNNEKVNKEETTNVVEKSEKENS